MVASLQNAGKSKLAINPLLIATLFIVLGARTLLAAEPDSKIGAALPISFKEQIAPVLVRKCLACHGAEKKKGGYQAHTFESLLKKGDSEQPPVMPGQPHSSALFQLITTTNAEDRMPQKDDPLPRADIALIERWIREGARFDGADPKALIAALVPRRPHPPAPAVYPALVPILAVAFTPNGENVVTGGYHELNIWSATAGTLVQRIANVAQRTYSVAFMANEFLAAAATGTPGELGELILFNPSPGATNKVIAAFPDVVLAVACSPAAQRVAAAGSDNSIRLHEIYGKERRVIQQHADWVVDLAFNEDGTQLISASRDRTARVFDADTGELECTYAGHEAPVVAARFTGDGKTAVSTGRDRRIHFWNLMDGKKIRDIPHPDTDVLKLATSTNSLYAAGSDGVIREYALGDGKLTRELKGHRDWVYSLSLSPDARFLASGSFDGEVRIWDLKDGSVRASFIAAPGWKP